MSDKWTDEQIEVIESRGQNLLVAAAAGSGKTAVLVERILRKILDRDHPLDLDHLLVVTFTNAAAAQLRQRIRDAVTEALAKDPDDPVAVRQMAQLHSDHIQTIDKFCLDLVRDHYNEIGMDPSFRIADEGELKLLRSDMAGEALEEFYAAGDQDFLDFSECYAPGRDDHALEEQILRFYGFSAAHPFPALWRKNCALAYHPGNADLNDAPWMQILLDSVSLSLEDCEAQFSEALAAALEADGPQKYAPALQDDLDWIGKLKACRDYDSYRSVFMQIKWARLSSKKDTPVMDPAKKEYVKNLRDAAKAAVGDLGKAYFSMPFDELKEDMEHAGRYMDILVSLTDLFEEKFRKAKEEKNIADFSDIEHAALHVLLKMKDNGEPLLDASGNCIPSGTALLYRDYFQEIYIDEYQDSNPVQELLLKSISREEDDFGNRFMVGDVKQSIYRFRMAEPEIFMEKYENYPVGDKSSAKRRIDLHKNFRSRAEVLDAVNLVFCQIMRKEIGGIAYGADEALYVGRAFPELKENGADDAAAGAAEAAGMDDAEAEAVSAQSEETVSTEAEAVSADNPFIPELILVEPADLLAADDSEEGDSDPSGGKDAELSADRDHAKDPELMQLSGERERAGENSAPENDADSSDSAKAESGDEDSEISNDKKKAEAAVVAERILQLTAHEYVLDDETKTYRPVRYGDIVILLRTAGKWAQIFSDALAERGIPFNSGSRTGYFSAPEVRTILAYLRVLDNPRQDIPLAASLRSEIGMLTDDELAMLKIAFPDESLYDRVRLWISRSHEEDEKEKADERTEEAGKAAGIAGAGEKEGRKGRLPGTEAERRNLTEKLERFVKMSSELRRRVCDTPIHLLLWMILDETGFGVVTAAQPSGQQKMANLDMLVEKAIAYEKTSYKGLFHFVRYIEKLKKYEVDFGEAAIAREDENLVRIMTIHRSKGLEFPVVFVSAMGGGFNMRDTMGSLLLHSRLGAGLDYVDPQQHLIRPVLMKKLIAEKIGTDSLGEEARVLYTAMTRAKEKLILTGCINDREKFVTKLGNIRSRKTEKLSYSSVRKAGSFLEWVLSALMRHREEKDFFDSHFTDLPDCAEDTPVYGLAGAFRLRTGREVLDISRAEEKAVKDYQEMIGSFDSSIVYDEALQRQLKEALQAAYPYPGHGLMPSKVSVSELKMVRYEEEMRRQLLREEAEDLGEILQADENDVKDIFKSGDDKTGSEPLPVKEYPVPEFMKEKAAGTGVSGAMRGTIYHAFLADYDFREGSDKDAISRQLETMVRCDKIQKDEADCIDISLMQAFLSSDLARRMKKAAERGMLFREMPFVYGLSAARIREDWDRDETILIQGIIDAYFIEDDRIVLIDYKTDRAKKGDEDSLVRRYRTQFDLYREALSSLLQKEVREAYLYSFALKKSIEVPEAKDS